MSARPDLTTEELIAFVEEHARIRRSWITPRLKDDVEARAENIERIREAIRFEAIAQRLRSERPVVTPEPGIRNVVRETLIANGWDSEFKGDSIRVSFERVVDTYVKVVEARLAALSVSSTKGKP